MKIALTQMETAWEDPAANERACARLAERAAQTGAALVAFPEFTLTGFTPRPRAFADAPSAAPQRAFADAPGDAPQLAFFRALSRRLPLAIAFGCIRAAEPAAPQNRLVVVRDGAVLLDYAKLHSYSFGGETRAYSRGAELFSAALDGFTLAGLICYDLRFPEIFQIAARTADILLVIGNWPADRIENWYTLLRARALETQCYLVGVNRAGAGGGIAYAPSSVVFDPTGRRLTPSSPDDLLLCDLDPQFVRDVRAAFPLRSDRRDDLYPSLVCRDYALATTSTPPSSAATTPWRRPRRPARR